MGASNYTDDTERQQLFVTPSVRTGTLRNVNMQPKSTANVMLVIWHLSLVLGHLADTLSEAAYNKCIFHKRETTTYHRW